MFPIQTQYSKEGVKINLSITESEFSKYFLKDVDFVTAVHKCLDGEVEENKELGVENKNVEKDSKLKLKIDDKFL